MSLLPVIELSDSDKLDTLRRLDQFRKWQGLDDQRYCLCCGNLLTGRDIQVVGGTRGAGPLRAVCPTERCNAIPMDWALPTDEVLSKESTRMGNAFTPVSVPRASSRRGSGPSPLRWLARRFKRSA